MQRRALVLGHAKLGAVNLAARVQELSTLNALGNILNREPDFDKALGPALAKLIDLLDLSTGWVFLTNVDEGDSHQGSFRLAAFTGLPPALERNEQELLCEGSCECQGMFSRGELDQGVNMVTCSRLKWTTGDKGGLEIHASIPLLAPSGPVGIINLAAPGKTTFDTETLAFLTTVGQQLGTAFERSRLQAERTREARYLATLEERNRLAQEMHDSVAQLLFAADLSLNVLQESRDEAQRQKALSRTNRLVSEALAELRSIVEVMRPADLSCGLKVALTRLAKRSSGLVKVNLEAEEIELAPDLAATLYRIAQEAVHNALRHAEAETIWLKLWRTKNAINLLIKDDGSGFDSAAITPGLGLDGMRERSQSLGGSFELTTEPEVGTSVEVSLPWPTVS